MLNTMNTSVSVNLLDLAAACISSSIVASDQIASLARAKNARQKQDGSFVTDADMAAQKIIVNGIRSVSSMVRIVCEENEEEMRSFSITGYEADLHKVYLLAQEEIIIRYRSNSNDEKNSNSKDELPLAQHGQQYKGNDHSTEEKAMTDSGDSSSPSSTYYCPKKDVYEIDSNRVSIFIDPLDATGSYAEEDYDPVSILVAIVLDDKDPCFGVIWKPFGYGPNYPTILDRSCVGIYGGTLLGSSYVAGSRKTLNDISKMNLVAAKEWGDAASALPRAVISKSRSEGVVQNFITYLADEMGMIDRDPLLVSGAGEKSLRIITRSQNEGLWFFPKGGTSLWDVAASDALLRSIGGKLTDKYGIHMDYSKPRTDAENVNGVIACCDEQLHTECIRLFLEWQDKQH